MHGPRTMIIAACCMSILWLGGCTRRSAPPPAPQPGRPPVLQPGQATPIKIGPLLPAWVGKGSGAYQEGSERYFFGVGSATTASGNRILARTAADNLARTELDKVLRRYLAALSHGRLDTAGGMDEGSLEHFVTDVLRKAMVTEHWTDPRDGRMYALCRLDLPQFKEALTHSSALEAPLRNHWLNMADREHARMVGMP
jgi:hypothetical protein